MEASGASSVGNYESGCPQLIALYQILSACPGVYGNRFAGGGFRGCCVGLSDPAYRDRIRATVREQYLGAFPSLASSFTVLFTRSGGPAQVLGATDG